MSRFALKSIPLAALMLAGFSSVALAHPGHGGGLTAGFFVEVGQYHFGAFTGQQHCIFATDATGGAGDDADFAFYTLHCCSPDRAV